MDRDKVEPLLFTAWLREFSRSMLFGRFGDGVSDYWDLRPQVMEAVLTERPDWCDDPKRPGDGELRGRVSPKLSKRRSPGCAATYGDDMAAMALGASACRGVCQPGVQPHPGPAGLARSIDPDRRVHTTRSTAARARSATTRTRSSSVTAPGCA